MYKKNKAVIKIFTLLELLIVIAIIVLLAGILLPGLQKAREKTRQIECISNLKQIGVGNGLYMGDYNEYTVPAYWYGWSSSPYQLLSPYFGTKLWTCSVGPLNERWMVTPTGLNIGWNTCAGYSSLFVTDGFRAGGWKRIQDVTQSPGSSVLSVDLYNARNSGGGLMLNGGSSTYWSLSPLKQTGGIDPRHSRGVNTLWLDAHAIGKKDEFSSTERYWKSK